MASASHLLTAVEVEEQFRELRRLTTKALASSYKSYVNNQIGDSLKTHPKRFWSFIKANKRENIVIPTLGVNDKPIPHSGNRSFIVFYVLFREHIRLRVRVQVSLLALLDKPTMAWLASAMSSQERLECVSTFRKRNMQHPSFSESELKLKILLNLQMTYIIIAHTYEQWDH